ncbi:MAG: tetratricopeptide repeat protein [Deltaproteobacteria bacterium]|nr:tetratricopeptide repeat protein [Deltaproteobacteria bacterium]
MRFAASLIPLCLVLCVSTAQANDWTLKRSPFDARLVGRYKQLLERRPNDGYALAKLIKLYRRYRTVGALLKEYRAKANSRPKSFPLQVIAGHLHRRTGDTKRAIAYYERAAKLRPKSPTAPAALGALYRRSGDSAKAQASYERALALARAKRLRKRYLRALANMALARRDLPAARAYFAKLVKIAPHNILLRIELAQSLARARLHKEAVEQYQKILVILTRGGETSTRANVLKEIGALQHQMGQADKAISTYRQAMRLAARGHYLRRELTDRIISIYREKEDLKTLIAHYDKKWKRRGAFEWSVLGKLYDETGDEKRAIASYRAALKRSPRAIDTRVRLISLLERSGLLKEVVAQFRTLARIANHEPRYQLELAKRLHRSGAFKEAISVLERCGRRFPRDASVHSALADLFARWGKQKHALREARMLVRIEPADDSHLVNLGEQYFMRGQKKKAVETWRRLLVAIRQKHRAYAKLAAIYGDHEMTDKALALYRKAIKLKPKMLPYQRELALLQERKRRHTDALLSWGRVLKLAQAQKAQQTVREARRHTIDILHRSYRLRHQIRAHKLRFKANPPDIDAGYFLAEAHYKLRKYPAAARVYRRILELQPTSVEALIALESIYRRQRKLADAVVLLKKLAQLQPSRRREFYERIASLELMLRNDTEALLFAHKALALGRQDARSYQRLGELYEKKGDYKKALEAYAKAAKISPNLPSVQFSIARLHTRQGQYDEAEKTYRKLIRNGRTPEEIRRAFRKGIVLSSYLGRLERMEKELLPLAMRSTPQAESYRRILVKIYQRRVPMLIYQARHGSATTKRAAKAQLAKIGLRGMAPLLEELAGATNTTSRQLELIRMLGYLGNSNAASALLRIAEKEPTAPPIVIYANRSRHYNPRGRSWGRRAPLHQRVEATIAVGRLADKRAIPGLLRLLRSAHGPLRDASAWALSRLSHRLVRRGLLQALGDPRDGVQLMACAGLGLQGGDARLQPILEEVMLDNTRGERVRAACAWSLGALGDKRAIDSLLRALESGYDELQRCAAWSLGMLQARGAVPRLVQALWSRKARVRQAMLWALSRISLPPGDHPQETPDVHAKGGHIDRDYFIAALTKPVENLDTNALSSSLLRLGDKASHPIAVGVYAALQRHRDVVLRVLRDLDRDPQQLTLSPLSDTQHLTPTQRHTSATILAHLSTQIAPALGRLLAHKDPLIRRRAISVLLKLRRADTGAQLRARWQKWSWRERAFTLSRLSQLKEPAVSNTTWKILARQGINSQHWAVREAAVSFLAVGPQPATKLLQRALSDANGFVRQAAVVALGGRAWPTRLMLLRRALQDDLAYVRASAIKVARHHHPRALRREIERAQHDPAPEVRHAATAPDEPQAAPSSPPLSR